MKRKINDGKNYLDGVINPIGWDDKGSANAYSLFTDDDEDIVLDFKHGPHQILKCMRERVRIFGRLKRMEDYQLMEVDTFRHLNQRKHSHHTYMDDAA